MGFEQIQPTELEPTKYRSLEKGDTDALNIQPYVETRAEQHETISFPVDMKLIAPMARKRFISGEVEFDPSTRKGAITFTMAEGSTRVYSLEPDTKVKTDPLVTPGFMTDLFPNKNMAQETLFSMHDAYRYAKVWLKIQMKRNGISFQ
jgi:hypothetical protein